MGCCFKLTRSGLVELTAAHRRANCRDTEPGRVCYSPEVRGVILMHCVLLFIRVWFGVFLS